MNQAFARKILRPPKYISAIYSIAEEYEKLAKRIVQSKHKDKKILVAQLKQNVIDWQHSSGIDAVIKKHLPKDRNRIIVFCQNFSAMALAEELLMPIFLDIFGIAMPIHIHSRYSDAHNQAGLKSFREYDDKVKIIFAVDKLNEGLHGKMFNTVFLMRETISPRIFYQQIGRCFSIGQQERPLIFDLVNNFRNIRMQEFKKEFEHETGFRAVPSQGNSEAELSDSPTIEFIDETLGLRQLITVFSDVVEHWEAYFKKAEQYFQENGHLYVTNDSPELKKWVDRQRRNAKENKLLPDKIRRLTEIGMDWSPSFKRAWLNQYHKLKEFVAKFNREPDHSTCIPLYAWLYNQRIFYKKGKLTEYQTKLLECIVPMYGTRQEIGWKEKTDAILSFYRATGGFKWKTIDPIYRVAEAMHKGYKSGKLPKVQLRELEKIGFPFKKISGWDQLFQDLKQFVARYQRFPTYKENKSLYTWIDRQIKIFQAGRLNAEKQAQLELMGIDLKARPGDKGEKNRTEDVWPKRIKQIIDYYHSKGSFNWTNTEPIYKVVIKIRLAWKANRLPESLLNQLEDIQFPFSYVIDWEDSFSELKKWVKIYKTLPTPSSKNKRLYRWMCAQIRMHRNGKLESGRSDRLAALGVKLERRRPVLTK